MLLRVLLLAAFAACLTACAPTAAPAQPGKMMMAITTIVDASTGATLKGDVYLDDHLIAKAVSTTTFSLGPLLHDSTVRIEVLGYLNWTVGLWWHNPSEASHTISGPLLRGLSRWSWVEYNLS